MTARELWERELRSGVDGQQRALPSTWKLDALWKAACWEATATDLRTQGLHRASDVMLDRAAICLAERLDDEALALEHAA